MPFFYYTIKEPRSVLQMNQSFFPVDPKIESLIARAEAKASRQFAAIDEIADYNAQKVLAAFIKHRVSEPMFAGTTGYGYNDMGREALDAVLAEVFGCEDALIRHNFVSGTHALTVALFGVLRPGDRILSITGRPYDTLEEVVGLRGEGHGSLTEWGVRFEMLDLAADGHIDWERLPDAARGARVVYIQRSRGYSLRPSVTVAEIERAASIVKAVDPAIILMVDNCYGEFVERREPTEAGADLIVGSLIKNPGGGIARTGGYIAGRQDLVELCAHRLTAPGVGKEVGCTLGESRNMFLGLFLAPTVVAAALKTAVLLAAACEELGYPVTPRWDEPRTDIIQAVTLGNEDALVAFCQGMQKGAPIDAYVTPEPWDMPGYESPVIMAAGAFTMGASIELSADAPIREPYAAWMQGGLTYPSGKVGVKLALQSMLEKKVFELE